jgi:integrase
MASVSRDANGTRRVLFTNAAGERKAIRLGRVTAKAAESFRLRVEALVEAQLLRQPLHADLAAWVADLPDAMHDRLVRAGLATSRTKAAPVTLGELLARFVGTASVKPGTLAAYNQTTSSLREHFGDDAPVASITTADADAWRKAIADSGLAPATVAKRVHVARAIFKRATRWTIIPASPFADLRAGSQANPDRAHYVPVADVRAIIDACPDAEWRAIVALSRFAGLRCPSEIVGLRWGDVDFARNRLTVRSPKTAGHDGHAVRVVPIDPALRTILHDLFDAAQVGVEAVVPRLRYASANLRTMLHKIMTRAGVKPWPRAFHNMRASCATDWVERFPAHVVAGWLGHSPMIAARHYLQTRDVHFDLAAGAGTSPAWGESDAEKSGAKSGALAAQIAAQHASAWNRTDSPESSEVVVGAGLVRADAASCEAASNPANGRYWIRTPTETKRETAGGVESGANCGALPDDRPTCPTPDPDLAAVIAAWPDLPVAIRGRVVALVREALPVGGGRAGDAANGPQSPGTGFPQSTDGEVYR